MTKKNVNYLYLVPIEGPKVVWRMSSVKDEPEVRLQEWDIKRDIAGNCYFVGIRSDDGWGRVSTPIVEFDPERGHGRTQSGRIYELVGPKKLSDNAKRLWLLHKLLYGITEPDSEQ